MIIILIINMIILIIFYKKYKEWYIEFKFHILLIICTLFLYYVYIFFFEMDEQILKYYLSIIYSSLIYLLLKIINWK